jgi:ribonuclease P protein component
MQPGLDRPDGFAPRKRLLSPKDYERVYALRRRVSDSFFSVNYAPSVAGQPRLGLSVGAKMVGNAVSRNRVKRTVRESFRLHQHQLPAVDLVVGARAMARTAHNARLRESLAELWKKIATQCAASPAE